MRLDELQVKNPECVSPTMQACKCSMNSDFSERSIFTFDYENMECEETTTCCPLPFDNAFSTMNECRKSCHYSDESDEESENQDEVESSGQCTGQLAHCLIMCNEQDRPERTVYKYNRISQKCEKVETCCPMGEFFLSKRECIRKCIIKTP